MMNFKQQLQQPLQLSKWVPIVMLVVALIGFADATYLAIEHLRGVSPNCSLLAGCDVVTSSKYSEIFGIPVALVGSLYYLSIFFALVAYFDTKKIHFFRVAAYLTPLGLLASAWFVYLQLGILKAICIYCMGSAISSTTLFIVAMLAIQKKNTN